MPEPDADRSKARVTGPFTVEAIPAPVVKPLDEFDDVEPDSAGPHRRSADERRPAHRRPQAKARQIFFPMAGVRDGWSRLARNLKAEIDQDLIEAYRGTVSLPFDLSDHGRAAVKIVEVKP